MQTIVMAYQAWQTLGLETTDTPLLVKQAQTVAAAKQAWLQEKQVMLMLFLNDKNLRVPEDRATQVVFAKHDADFNLLK